MLGLALGQRNVAFDLAGFPVQVERHQGVAFLLDLANQALDLFLVHQKLLGARLVRADVGRCRAQRGDLQADQEQLAIANNHITIGQLHLALAQRFDLPAFQHQTRLETLLKEIVVGSLLVVGNAGSGFGFFGHGVNLGM